MNQTVLFTFRFFLSIILLIVTAGLLSCTDNDLLNTDPRHDIKPTTVRLGLSLQPAGSLFYIAQEKGYFKRQNIDVVVTNYPSGKRALNEGLLKGREDLITTAEVPFVFSSFTQKQLKIVSSIFVADNVNSIIARRDAGILKPADLKGKKISTQQFSAVHYFLNLFLLENNIKNEEIINSYMKAEKLPKALFNGVIDGFSMREPYISEAKGLLGDNAIIFNQPGIYNQVELLVSNDAFIKSKPEAVEKILTALMQAEKFILKNPIESDAILSEKFGVSLQEAKALRLNFSHRIVLDQPMISLLEGVGRWAIANKAVKEKKLPDYMKYIHYSAMSKVAPHLIRIIH